MSISTPPRPPRSDVPPDIEALEALIEEARQRARRRRRGYAACALAAAAAALLGFYGFSGGGEPPAPEARAERPAGAAAALARGDWQPARGFEGGAVWALAFDGKNPETVFAATLRGGVAKSSNGGGSWRALDIEHDGGRFDVLAVAPQDPQTIYAGGTRIFKSADGGTSWEAVDSGLFGKETAGEREHRYIEGLVYSLAVDPSDPDVVYAGTWKRGVLKTTNGGASWRRLGLRAVTPVVVDPEDPDTLYAGATGAAAGRRSTYQSSGVFKSSDGGESWRRVGLKGTTVGALALDPRRPSTIYAATSRKGVLKSTDGGASWRATGLAGGDVSALMVDPRKDERVYALSDYRIFISNDGGDGWQKLGAGWAPGVLAGTLAVDPRDPEKIYVGTFMRANGGAGEGVFKSVDGGDSWRPMNAGLTDASVSALALDPRSPGMAYASVEGRGVFKRVHGRWRAGNSGLPSVNVQTLAVDPQHPATVYAGAEGSVSKSTNGGTSWTDSSTALVPEPAAVSALAVDPQNPATVYATTANDATYYGGGMARTYESLLYKSTDGGITWLMSAGVQNLEGPAPSGDDTVKTVHETPLAIDPLRPRTLYAGGSGVRKSIDGGATWQSAGLTRTAVLALAVDPKRPASVYAGTDAGLFTSTDAGASWQTSEGPLDDVRVEALAIDPRVPRTVYAATNSGVFWSADDGHSWHRFTRLPTRAFHALAVDTAADVVYAGSNGGGLFELELRP